MLTKNLKTTALTAATFAAALIASDARADGGPYQEWEGYREAKFDRYDDYNRKNRKFRRQTKAYRSSDAVVLERKVFRYFRNDRIALRRVMKIGSDYRGHRIDSIVVTTKPGISRGRIRLLVNGRHVDSERLGKSYKVRLHPESRTVIGRTVRSIQLGIKGKVYIKNIKVKLAKPKKRRHAGGYGHDRHNHRQEPTVIRIPTDRSSRIENNPWVIFSHVLNGLPRQF